MLVHTGKKEFQCHVCGKSNLTEHFVIHNFYAKMFKCDKSFTLKGNVKKHTIVHAGKKDY